MAENKMEQVAELFGKKLGENFRVKNEPYNDYVFTEEGLYVVNTSNVWVPTQEPRTLHDLLTGKAEITKDEKTTNREWLASMSNKELADFLDDVETSGSVTAWECWLEAEREVNEDGKEG